MIWRARPGLLLVWVLVLAGEGSADPDAARATWWSLRPLVRPPVPRVKQGAWVRNPVDAFILARLEEKGLSPSPEADRSTLIRRLGYDLHGLPPTPEEVDAFLADTRPDAYERLVDRLLASPRYGERWARHWLDVAHYGDTHGYDKDKLRPNAWPYRDYVIRAFNEDKPWARFVREQVAGDVLAPGTRDGIAALGFLAAGPWDFVGHVELREGTLDKKITRNLDRDDMVATTMNAFVSLTVQCARCHDHKLDPISQEDYYSLQAVFAAVDRADRPLEEPDTARQRQTLAEKLARLEARRRAIDREARTRAGAALTRVEGRMAALGPVGKGGTRPEYGYHSAVAATSDVVKWVQVDLGKPVVIEHIVHVGCHDTFNNIGAGFGFPVRYRIEISDDETFRKGVTVVLDRTGLDFPNPGVVPQSVQVGGKRGRHVRVTATRLAPRRNDYIFALAELSVLTADGANAARGAKVTALDSIEAPVRWRRTNLVDGYWYGAGTPAEAAELARLEAERKRLLEDALDASQRQELAELTREEQDVRRRLGSLPAPGMVYAAATSFPRQGSFSPTGGKPRPIHILDRGSEKSPGQEVGPGALGCVASLEARFALKPGDPEGMRRAALAEWIVSRGNPLTWRSVVNRVWQYHFGRGIVETPSDFGMMGARPTHPELLDWLAVEFRDGGQSLKALHRLLVTSAAYRQASAHREDQARVDSGNQLLWRMGRQRLEAEAIRDTVLAISGKLDARMYGPGYRPFGFRDDHSPHYLYEEHDPDDPASHRRSIYRFIVRSVPDPLMTTLDCADPSLAVARRNETLTALQALTLLNNRLMVRMAEHFAARVRGTAADLPGQIRAAYRLALGREPRMEELVLLEALGREHGLENVCRLIFNMNELVFVD